MYKFQKKSGSNFHLPAMSVQMMPMAEYSPNPIWLQVMYLKLVCYGKMGSFSIPYILTENIPSSSICYDMNYSYCNDYDIIHSNV